MMGWQALAVKLDSMAAPAWSSPRVAVASIAGTWGLFLAFIAVRLTMNRFPDPLLLMPWQCLNALAYAEINWVF